MQARSICRKPEPSRLMLAPGHHETADQRKAEWTSCGTLMEQIAPPRPALPPRPIPHPGWRAVSILLAVIAVALLLLVLRAKLQGSEVPPLLMVAVLAAFC